MVLSSENINTPSSKFPIRILQWACFFIFAGRAWQHLIWDAPFRAVLWDQELMQGIIEATTGMSWEEYTSSVKAETIIQFFIRATGWLYALCAVLSISLNSNLKWLGKILLIGAGSLFLLALLNCKEKFLQLGEFMEHGIQVLSPVFLYYLLFRTIDKSKLIFAAKIAVALTFIGHGLYAVNYYPQPGPYVDMMINVFHLEEGLVKIILKVLGVLDFIFSILIFIPVTAPLALIYCGVWGLLTAMARLVAGFDSNFPIDTLNQYSFETIYRLGNFLIPLWIYYTQKHFLKELAVPNHTTKKFEFKTDSAS
jgi:hypothetical protein